MCSPTGEPPSLQRRRAVAVQREQAQPPRRCPIPTLRPAWENGCPCPVISLPPPRPILILITSTDRVPIMAASAPIMDTAHIMVPIMRAAAAAVLITGPIMVAWRRYPLQQRGPPLRITAPIMPARCPRITDPSAIIAAAAEFQHLIAGPITAAV